MRQVFVNDPDVIMGTQLNIAIYLFHSKESGNESTGAKSWNNFLPSFEESVHSFLFRPMYKRGKIVFLLFSGAAVGRQEFLFNHNNQQTGTL